eukprot:CAMPEP_0198729118 /NCGR_PEP_ID=MMETSP1475-20131203/14888_1 /TAXON_ID= ORGANISM="Unidentified sp., Strain CCMP1999" /NCGR_SAMPLE_ID=MMETSP1475 /ASSEMBLY_ACC=CAM_ASM_001111 /LENGTH=242 /DNA_ID=CAMNT_0044491687 /DNA_START=386 /DNA_END=1115 /DNA_ORIENTATION=-
MPESSQIYSPPPEADSCQPLECFREVPRWRQLTSGSGLVTPSRERAVPCAHQLRALNSTGTLSRDLVRHFSKTPGVWAHLRGQFLDIKTVAFTPAHVHFGQLLTEQGCFAPTGSSTQLENYLMGVLGAIVGNERFHDVVRNALLHVLELLRPSINLLSDELRPLFVLRRLQHTLEVLPLLACFFALVDKRCNVPQGASLYAKLCNFALISRRLHLLHDLLVSLRLASCEALQCLMNGPWQGQ